MNDTYTAWNGEERPWPPPENWYRAADGRWWHPAYGPDDKPDDRPESLPVWDVKNRHTSSVDAEPEPVSAVGRNVEPSPKAEPELEPEPELETPLVDPGPTHSTGRKPWVASALIAVAVLVTAAVAQFVLAGSSDEVATDPEEAPAVLTDDDLTTAATADPPSTASSSTTTESQVADVDDEVDEPIPSSESDPEAAAAIADFRRQLGERGLSTDELTDEQITTFASTYCVYAGGAEDRAAFDELRRVAVTSSRSNLTPTQLNLTITTAVVVFCPEESERLGITFEG